MAYLAFVNSELLSGYKKVMSADPLSKSDPATIMRKAIILPGYTPVSESSSLELIADESIKQLHTKRATGESAPL
jgi:hypothetical protein